MNKEYIVLDYPEWEPDMPMITHWNRVFLRKIPTIDNLGMCIFDSSDIENEVLNELHKCLEQWATEAGQIWEKGRIEQQRKGNRA